MAKLVMAREERTLSAAEAAIMATAIEQAKTKALINGLAQRPKPTTEPASGDKTVLKQQYEDLVKQVYVLLKTKIELFTYQIEPYTPIERSFFSFVRLVFFHLCTRVIGKAKAYKFVICNEKNTIQRY